jgi:Leucine-rich repeat (LRR) protein
VQLVLLLQRHCGVCERPPDAVVPAGSISDSSRWMQDLNHVAQSEVDHDAKFASETSREVRLLRSALAVLPPGGGLGGRKPWEQRQSEKEGEAKSEDGRPYRTVLQRSEHYHDQQYERRPQPKSPGGWQHHLSRRADDPSKNPAVQQVQIAVREIELYPSIDVIRSASAAEGHRRVTPLSSADPSQGESAQRHALSQLYAATEGDQWWDNTAWLSSSSECSWYGVTCDSFGSVTELQLEYNGLLGIIPPSLSFLTNLTRLDLRYNHIGGVIPNEIGRLEKLKYLMLASNQIQGSIDCLAPLTNLLEFDLYENQVEAGAPVVYNFPRLTFLDLSANRPTLAVDLEPICRLTNLTYLDLSRCAIGSSIPRNIGQLTQLTFLRLERTMLVGTIPASLAACNKLYFMSLAYNNLSGLLPDGFGSSFPFLNGLHLRSNQLEGELPADIGNLKSLERLFLDSNRFHDLLPGSVGSLLSLSVLSLSDNQFNGPLPDLANLIKMRELNIGVNRFSGGLPTWISGFTELRVLYAGSSGLGGEIDPTLFAKKFQTGCCQFGTEFISWCHSSFAMRQAERGIYRSSGQSVQFDDSAMFREPNITQVPFAVEQQTDR